MGGTGIELYVPPHGTWATRPPEAVGLDRGRLDEAVAFALAHETPWDRDLERQLGVQFGDMPDSELVGPVKPRGAPNGLVVRGGYLVAEWGDTHQVDMTFSVTKSYLSTMAGLALDRGLIRDLHDPVREYVRTGHFDSEHNRAITWHHLLRQTSEWDGTLWDKPVAHDRPGSLGRPLRAPGTFHEYNDVRVNLLAFALLHVWRRPLPEVFRELVADPIGCADTWQWHGYRNSWVEIDGRPMQSVSGGGHWGGGLWIHARDQARFGLLWLRRGRWGDRQLISERWIDLATAPGDIEPTYGYMWWVNPARRLYPSAPESAFAAHGAGANIIFIDPEHDLVVVARWLDPELKDALIARVLAALPT